MAGKEKMLNKCLKLILAFVSGMGLGVVFTAKKTVKALTILRVDAKKNQVNCQILSQWLLLRAEGKKIAEYLKFKGYHTVAVYGINYIGEILLKELIASSIQVAYAVDKRAEYIDTEVDVLKPDAELPEVDVVIVTTSMYFEEIKLSMREKVQCPIISLEEILYELLSSE